MLHVTCRLVHHVPQTRPLSMYCVMPILSDQTCLRPLFPRSRRLQSVASGPVVAPVPVGNEPTEARGGFTWRGRPATCLAPGAPQEADSHV